MTDAQPATRHCPWCDAAAPEEATTCPACGAALAQREDLAGLVIPGVTTVDPVLQAFDARPHHLSGNSPSQSAASAVIPAVVLGGPIGAAALGGIVAVAAAEYLGARRESHSTPESLEAVGRPSEAAVLAAALLDRGQVPGGAVEASTGPAVDEVTEPPEQAPWATIDGSPANSDNSTRD